MIGFLRNRCLTLILLIAGVATALADPMTINVVGAELGYDQRTREPIVSVRMSRASALTFGDLTTKNVGRKLEYKLDGRPIMSPRIMSPILGGVFQIVRSTWSVEEAKSLTTRLSSGAAKLEVRVID